jgi:hypothetical protein
MADQFIACPSCGKRIPLTRALRADIEASVKAEYGERERELREEYQRKLESDRERVEKDAAKRVEKKLGQEVAGLKDQLKDQAREADRGGHVQRLGPLRRPAGHRPIARADRAARTARRRRGLSEQPGEDVREDVWRRRWRAASRASARK